MFMNPKRRIPISALFSLGVPVLGICYGMQLMSYQLGGSVEKAERREYGPATIDVDDGGDLFRDIEQEGVRVWMSHGDRILELPAGFKVLARSENSPAAAMGDPRPTLLRGSVSPGSGAHALRSGASRKLSVSHLPLPSHLDHEIIRG